MFVDFPQSIIAIKKRGVNWILPVAPRGIATTIFSFIYSIFRMYYEMTGDRIAQLKREDTVPSKRVAVVKFIIRPPSYVIIYQLCIIVIQKSVATATDFYSIVLV